MGRSLSNPKPAVIVYRALWNGKQLRKLGEPDPVLGQQCEWVNNGRWFYVNDSTQILTEEEWLKHPKRKALNG